MWWEFKESISIMIILLHDTEKYPVVMTSCFCRYIYIYRYLIYLVILKSPERIFCQTNVDIKNFVLISCTKWRRKQLFVNKTIKNCNGANLQNGQRYHIKQNRNLDNISTHSYLVISENPKGIFDTLPQTSKGLSVGSLISGKLDISASQYLFKNFINAFCPKATHAQTKPPSKIP